MTRLAFAADQLTYVLKLLRHALVVGHNFVEGVGDFAEHTCFVSRHADGKIAGFDGLKGMEQLVHLRAMAVEPFLVHLIDGGGRDCASLCGPGNFCAFALCRHDESPFVQKDAPRMPAIEPLTDSTPVPCINRTFRISKKFSLPRPKNSADSPSATFANPLSPNRKRTGTKAVPGSRRKAERTR